MTSSCAHSGFATVVVPPAFEAPAAGHSASEFTTSRDCGRDTKTAHPYRCVLERKSAARAHLGAAVVTPTQYAPNGCHGARVSQPSRNRTYAAAKAQHIDRSRAVDGCPISQLPAPVVSPAFHSAGGGHSAGVVGACRKRKHTYAHACHRYRDGATDRRGVSELAVIVVSPTHHFADSGQGACVIPARQDGAHPTAKARYVYWRPSFCPGAIPELAVGIVSPALNSAAAGQCACVRVASGDLGRLNQHRDPGTC